MYLLAINIGPVQDFITTARRSRDLWFGSWLLSEVSKAAAFAICEGKNEHLSRLIFPSVQSINDIDPMAGTDFNVVNKILARVHNPKAASDVARTAMQERLDVIRRSAYSKIPRDRFFNEALEAKALAQVKDMLEFLWAAYPFEDDSEYPKARDKVETLLNARRVTRGFASTAEWASNAPKSALDGQRESVIHEDLYDLVSNGEMTQAELRRKYNLRPGERLCGVGLLKRNGNRGSDGSFFSTSHVAALPLLERLTDVVAVKNYAQALGAALGVHDRELGWVPFKSPYRAHDVFSRNVDGNRVGYDGHILFSERLDDLVEDKNDRAKTGLKDARNALKGFLEEALDGKAPRPYYAMLMADGDNMSMAIDGLTVIDQHRKLSQNLSTFAESVKSLVVEKYRGSLVYAGGDDVLAFVPIHTVLQCARELANSFKSKLKEFAFLQAGKPYQPTLSVGVVIAHHLEPLQDSLALVREAERIAKAVDGKEALAIILSKRSGFDTKIKGGWKTDGARGALDHRVLRFAQLHLAGDIPDGAAYELRDLFLRLNCDKSDPEYTVLQRAMRDEAVRILARKQIANEKILNELTSDIKSETTSIEALANELIVAREFARAFDQAGRGAKDLESDIAGATGGPA